MYDQEIAFLEKQKREIEQRIKTLKRNGSINGRVKLDAYGYAGNCTYYVAVKRWNVDGVEGYEERYMPVVVANDKIKAIYAIRALISDLQE